jgi:5-(carboxyamino)imidazole ribonucleotide synthase
VVLRNPDDAAAAWVELGKVPCIVEGFVDYRCEVSVIAARSQRGEVVCFDPGENVHRDGILRTTTVPAEISDAERAEALRAATTVVERLDYVGVAGVELFVTAEGLAVNEIAPRVHNSGHWTQNGCAIDQFEQHVRSVAGWPLGDGRRHSDVEMTNLIGDDVLDVPELARDPALALHVYGKAEVRPGRKMGHVNRITGPAGI